MYVLKHPKNRFVLTTVLLLKTRWIPFARKKIRMQKIRKQTIKRQTIKRQMIKHQVIKRQMIKHQTIKRQRISDNTNEASLIDKENFQKFVVNDIKDETVKSSSINQKKLL